MSKRKANITLSILLTAMLLSEIYILNQNFALKKKISNYGHLEQLLEQVRNHLSTLQLERKLEGTNLPFLSKSSLTTLLKNELNWKRSKFILLFVFTLKDCPAGLEKEITVMNDINGSYHAQLCQVISITDTSELAYLENFIHSAHIQFPVYLDSNLKQHLSEMGVVTTPILFFINSENMKVIYT